MQKDTFHITSHMPATLNETSFLRATYKRNERKERETVVNVPSAGQQHRKNKHQAYGIMIFIRNFAPGKQRRGHAPKHKVKDYGETI